jgi:XisH protein
LEVALGQYHLYLRLLAATAPERKLYLAVSREVHDTFFNKKGIKFVVESEQLSMMVVDTEKEEVVRWID